MNKTLTFHADPAHGWLEVPAHELYFLNIAHKISRYSYTDTKKVYLEEDCDAALYFNAAKRNGWNITTTEKFTNGESFIRRLPKFTAIEGFKGKGLLP
jgi:hypothetical protein